MYLIAKHTHLTLMLISVSFLIIRVLASTKNAQWLQQKWVKIAPHVIDTLLLASAVSLMVSISQYPVLQHWLSAKVIALIAYILFGTLAFKGQRSTAMKLVFLILALSCIGFMISVAITKSPMPWSL